MRVVDCRRRPQQLAVELAQDEQYVGGARAVHDSEPGVQSQPRSDGFRALPRERETARRRGGGEARECRGQAHSSARSRQVYRMPNSRMTMNMNISISAIRPSSTNTTAHGYMKTISMSKARKSRDMG